MSNQKMTLGGFLDSWLEKVVKGSVRYSTYIAYKGYINNHIKRFMDDTLLVDLKPVVIQNFVCKLIGEVRLCARTIRIIVAMLGNALNYAEDYELINRNPCKRIKLPKAEEEEIKVFTNIEQTHIEKAVMDSDDNRLYGIIITLYTGLRIGELCALKWANIDFENTQMKVTASLNRIEQESGGKKACMAEQEPKTKKSKRVIQLPDFLIPILKKLKAESNGEYVISMISGKFVNPRTMQIIYKKLLEKAGVDYGSFHALRHTFATRAAELNADVKTVSETLGHTNTMITLNRYTHSLKEQKRKMMRNLDSYFRNKNMVVFSK